MVDFTQKTWVDVPDEANPPVGAIKTEAAEFNRLEQGIADSIDHANAVYEVHGGLVWYVAASSAPPTNPPSGLPWWYTDTNEAVVNTGTPSVPVWQTAFLDPSKLTAADLVTDYVVSGLLPSVPTNSLTLSVPSGAAYASGRRVSTTTASRTVPARRATLVDLSYLGVFSNVDYGILLDDTEDAWLEKTDADFTQSVVAGPTGQGNAVRFIIAAGASAGDSVSEAIPIADLTPYGKIAVWVRSSVTVTAGQLQLLLDNTAQVASPVHTLNIPDLVANVWALCEIAYDNSVVGTGSIISIGLKYTVDVGAATVDICKPYALKATEPAVSANSIRLFEARADADIAQVELVDITAAVNSTAYTQRINGVDIVYTSDASATEGEIALGLVAAINASADPNVTPVTAATTAIAGDASANFTLTADVPGVAFTLLSGTNLSSANQVPNSVSSVIEVVDRRDLDPTLRGGVAPGSAAATMQVDFYDTAGSYTWTKPAGCQAITIVCQGGGGGGGSGRRGAAATVRAGGGGGGGGARTTAEVPAAALPSTLPVVVGAAGAGGAAITADTTSGNAGTAGGDSSVGSSPFLCRAKGGTSGAGGTTSGVAGGAALAISDGLYLGGAGGASNSAATGTTATNAIIPGGGGGGSISGGNSNFGGGNGADSSYGTLGGTGGSAVPGQSNASSGLPGGGGGGGNAGNPAGGVGSSGGSGGDYGTGGGGGGGALNGSASGAGGTGGKGCVLVISYLST